MKAFATIIAAGLALVFQGVRTPAQAINANGQCTGMTVTDFLSSDVNQSTDSKTFVTITDGQLNFTTSATGCVMITFSAVATVGSNTSDSSYEQLRVRTLLDANSPCVPAKYNDTFLSSVNPAPAIAASITRICKNVAAGVHTLRVQYAASGVSGSVGLGSHILTITHN